MVYILNTSLKENKKCVVALNKIFGLGHALCLQICDQLGFSAQVKFNQLNATQIDRLTRCISQNYMCSLDLREHTKKSVERLISISSYRGFRYIEGLPCRGQRTHGNAQTARRCNVRFAAALNKRTTKKSPRSWKKR